MASTATDPRERMALVEGDQPTPANEGSRPVSEMTLAERMAAIRDECSGIGKEDVKMHKDGKSWTIKGHTVEAVLSEIRPLFTRFRVDMTPNLVERSYNGNRCDVIVDFEFASLDDATDTKTFRWGGSGTDNGDKAFAKAGTNAIKEMLKKRFLVTDRDDAKEETDPVEHQTDDAVQRRRLEQETEKRRSAVMKGLNGLKVAIDGAATASDLKRIRRDSHELLADEAVPAVTRTFFEERFAERELELSNDFPGDHT